MKPNRDPDRTRQLLLDAAFAEIHEHGYQGASLDNILAETGVTKGALYHHFKNKQALGYAVVDEVIRPMMQERWVAPLFAADDPIEALGQILKSERAERDDMACFLGCPLNNLAQEMSPLDEGFRTRIHRLLEAWQDGIAQALRQGQERGKVRADVDPGKTAIFLVATLEGAIGLAKNAHSTAVLDAAAYGLERFLNGLRPVAEPAIV